MAGTMLPMVDNACATCTKDTGRHPGCHATCERYKADLERHLDMKATQKKNSRFYKRPMTAGLKSIVRSADEETQRGRRHLR